MKHITSIALLSLGLVALASLVAPGFRPPAEFRGVVHAAAPQTLVLDIAVDGNTIVSGETRGASYIINGKIFPGGTLPSKPNGIGMAGNNPIEPFNGVAPIGEYLVRGQHAIALTPGDPFFVLADPATNYYAKNYISSRVPLGLATVYFLLYSDAAGCTLTTNPPNLSGCSTIITEGYDVGPNIPPPGAFLAIVGGVGKYSGAAGNATDIIISQNTTPMGNNSRVTFTFAQPTTTTPPPGVPTGAPTAVISGAPVIETLYREISLDGSASKNDTGTLKYSWTTEGTGVAILDSTSPQTRIQIQSGQADYPVTLTVTNSAGQSASTKAVIHFVGR